MAIANSDAAWSAYTQTQPSTKPRAQWMSSQEAETGPIVSNLPFHWIRSLRLDAPVFSRSGPAPRGTGPLVRCGRASRDEMRGGSEFVGCGWVQESGSDAVATSTSSAQATLPPSAHPQFGANWGVGTVCKIAQVRRGNAKKGG